MKQGDLIDAVLFVAGFICGIIGTALLFWVAFGK